MLNTTGTQMAKEKETKPDNEICFTIMPFGGWFDNYYSQIYSHAIEESGLVPRRADDVYRPGTIVHDIWDLTKTAKIIVADLTGKNPNVLYELGLAHALAKPVILITESLDDIPFDLRALRIIEYNKNDPEWGDILKEKTKEAIREVSESPLKAVLPAFLEVDETKPSKKISAHDKEILEIKHELDVLRRNVVRTNYLHPVDPPGGEDDPIWIKKIESLGLSRRTLNILKVEEIYFIGQLVQNTEVDLLKLPSLGKNSLIEVRESLAAQGLSLGLRHPFLKEIKWH